MAPKLHAGVDPQERIDKINRPIGLNQSFQRMRSEIKQIGRYSGQVALFGPSMGHGVIGIVSVR